MLFVTYTFSCILRFAIYEHPTLHARESTEISALQSRELFIKSIFHEPKERLLTGYVEHMETDSDISRKISRKKNPPISLCQLS